jgi:DNA replication protein DnaC
MKEIENLNLGFSDATNYQKRQNKDLFNKLFVRLPSIDRLIDPNRYFLIGDKGTGKTAFAVYLSNNNYKNNKCDLIAINETEYQSFIHLKKKENLQLSGYDQIWRVILLLLLAQSVTEKDCDLSILKRNKLFQKLKDAIDSYYNGAFSPEIITALKIVEGNETSVRLMYKILEGSSKEKAEISAEESKFQANLRLIERGFISALGSVKLCL